MASPARAERQQAQRALKELQGVSSDAELILVHEDEARVVLPPSLMDSVLEILGHLSRGNQVIITPQETHLTTGEVARMLGCSRLHVVKLIDEGKLKASKVGTHRRVLVADLEEFKRRDYEERSQALEEYMALSYELFGDDE